MNLPRNGTEYVHIPITGAPADSAPMEVSFDDGATWHTATWDAKRTSVSILVSGADATGGLTLGVGRHPVSVRLIDAPEHIVRDTYSTVDVD